MRLLSVCTPWEGSDSPNGFLRVEYGAVSGPLPSDFVHKNHSRDNGESPTSLWLSSAACRSHSVTNWGEGVLSAVVPNDGLMLLSPGPLWSSIQLPPLA